MWGQSQRSNGPNILGYENIKGPWDGMVPGLLHSPVSCPPRCTCMLRGHRYSLPASRKTGHPPLLLRKSYVFVPFSLLVRGHTFPLLSARGFATGGVLRDSLFNKKGKIQIKLADRNPPWSETRSQRSQCGETMLAWGLWASVRK